MTTIDTPAVREYARLTMERRELKKQLGQVQKKLDAVGVPLLNDMVVAGVRSMKLEDSTVFLVDATSAKLKDREKRAACVQAMDELGLDDLLRRDFNLNTVSAWCREVLEGGEEIPPSLLEHLDVIQGPELRVRKNAS